MGPIHVLGTGTVVLAALASAIISSFSGPSTVSAPAAPMPTPIFAERTVPNTAPSELSVQTVVQAPSNPPTRGIENVVSPPAPAPVAIAPGLPARLVAVAMVTAPAKVVSEAPAALRPVILAAAAKHGVPSEILSAALARESANFKEKYVYGWHVDGTGRGIAGIDKQYHPEVSDKDAFDPVYSIDWMAKYLSGLIKKNKGDVHSALREYNGGPNFASMRAGYQGRPVAELTRAHADAIYAHAAKAIAVR